jgi:DNA-binding CsgD family transcriptional regulator/pimeloyl-ACP methyl ester carboxylesterase
MDDIRAVMDAVGSERAALVGLSEGGAMAILFAAVYPERTAALVAWGAMPRRTRDVDFPWAPSGDELRRSLPESERAWAERDRVRELAAWCLPEADTAEVDALATMYRRGASPGAATAMSRMNLEIDVRPALPAVRAPTLVGWREEEPPHVRDGSRLIAAAIPGARTLALPGPGHLPFGRDDGAVEAIVGFLREPPRAPAPARPVRRPARWPAGLTDREVEILREVARGRRSKQVARELGISVRTVDHHVDHIYEKVGVRTRAGLALFALEHGMLGA